MTSPEQDPEPLAMILVAEPHRIGMFDHGNLASIAGTVGQEPRASYPRGAGLLFQIMCLCA